MSCTETRSSLAAFLGGGLAGDEARRVRRHLSECPSCAAALPVLDRVELLPSVDPEIEPSADLADRFRARLERHRLEYPARTATPVVEPWWRRFLAWSTPRQLAAAAVAAAFIAFGIYVGVDRTGPPAGAPLAADIPIAENLPLLRDMAVIQNLDLLEDFDEIRNLAAGPGGPTVQ